MHASPQARSDHSKRARDPAPDPCSHACTTTHGALSRSWAYSPMIACGSPGLLQARVTMPVSMPVGVRALQTGWRLARTGRRARCGDLGGRRRTAGRPSWPAWRGGRGLSRACSAARATRDAALAAQQRRASLYAKQPDDAVVFLGPLPLPRRSSEACHARSPPLVTPPGCSRHRSLRARSCHMKAAAAPR